MRTSYGWSCRRLGSRSNHPGLTRRAGLHSGLVANVVLRLFLLYFTIETLVNPGDPRFAGKNLGMRNIVIVLTFSLLFPVLHRWWKGKPWKDYPIWTDNLYLSMFELDMAGNSLDLYETFKKWSLIPHFHGGGVVAAVARLAFRRSWLEAVGISNSFHIILEAQEFYTDVYGGTRNVGGVDDTLNDLLAGFLGASIYAWLVGLVRRKRYRDQDQQEEDDRQRQAHDRDPVP